MKRLILLSFLAIGAVFTASAHRDALAYGTPESVGMNGKYLHDTIDSIVNNAIKQRCFPGCQVLVARRGKIVLNKSYGHHTYDSITPVKNNHLYDIASCTKVMAPTLCLMRLVEQKKISLDAPLSNYFEEFKGTDKESATLREFLTHQSGIRNMSLYGLSLSDRRFKLRSDIFSTTRSSEFPNVYCNGLYTHKGVRDTIFKAIANYPIGTKTLRYTCLAFHTFPTIIERITGRSYEDYLYEEFYTPLGAENILYNPLRKYTLKQIVPTEEDKLFRKTLTHGYVHDEAAAALGGVSGNAGIFASAESIAPILQMLLNKGTYDGKRYFKRKTVKEWTSCQYPENNNYRALGFDRRRFNDLVIYTNRSYFYAQSVSESSYGHSGFTGTMVWVDPEEDLIFIFLSNRVHPTRKNKAFSSYNPRARCHEAAYQAIRMFRGR